MTRQEFIQEAALRLISVLPEQPMDYIAISAKELADQLFHDEEEPQEPEVLTGIPDKEPIGNLLREIDRIDEEICYQKREQYKECKARNKPQKNGYAERVRGVCHYDIDITYVADLINYGRSSFKKKRNIGEKCCVIIDKALENLYDIKAW